MFFFSVAASRVFEAFAKKIERIRARNVGFRTSSVKREEEKQYTGGKNRKYDEYAPV